MSVTPEEALVANEALVRSYQACFGSPAGKVVLNDLMPFCRAIMSIARLNEPIDPHRALVLEGRRQVFLRIQTMMNMTPDQILALSGVPTPGEKNE